MSVFRTTTAVSLLLFTTAWVHAAGRNSNRLTYLDDPWNPYYVSRAFPRLTTPQWVGEEGVEAVVILAIDDMRDPRKYEAYLRPLLDRLKQIDGRAPVSIMTNQVDPNDPLLQRWLKEGLSLETHTIDHPCPLLAKGDFAAARTTYGRCVDLMAQVPNGTGPVAFRMPCCDSLNTPSPRFYAEIFDKPTAGGRYLQADSSVFNITTANDPELPRELVLDPDGRERFRKYLPFESFVNTIEDYPYPYVMGGSFWQFPCATPSDWEAQNLLKPDNPRTVEDWKALLDATVIKRGMMTMVFHPHNWIKPQQLVELVDHAVSKHGKKVKFLTFPEALERLHRNLLVTQPLRGADGADNGVRLLDVNNDGYLDVVFANVRLGQSRVWVPEKGYWDIADFPTLAAGSRFGVIRPDGAASVFTYDGDSRGGAWSFDGKQWAPDEALAEDMRAQKLLTSRHGADVGTRLRDVDGDGRCELIAGGEARVHSLSIDGKKWNALKVTLPDGIRLADAAGRDQGVRFVDVNEDGFDDVLVSDGKRSGLYLYTSVDDGWGKNLLADGDQLPAIVRADGTNNGAWFHSRHLWVQNEDTAGMPNLVDRRSFAELTKTASPGPKSPEASLACLQVRPGFAVELVAAEPLVMDPVNFDWGPDGKLWVVEMGDYPLGLDGKGKPGGRVRLLEDADGDGKYDKSTLFLEGLPYADGVLAWRNGVLITAAPDILYAEDTDGDGKADRKEVLFTGFARGNPQHLVNGFARGLDNWLYGANGHSGGIVASTRGGEGIPIGGRDFRIRPDQFLIDPQAGLTQFGRSRDDWGNFFGCDNSTPIWHYVLEDHYTRRNPHLAPPGARHDLAPAQMPIFSVSRVLERFNDFDNVNRITSANSVHVYRDDLFGPQFENNWFVSEPVHNLIHRGVLEPDGVSFRNRRAAGEEKSEFLASTDNWFRPAASKTGPDGALWVADMYRYVIEHPEWIPMDWQRRVDLRAGADKGRIYRVAPVGAPRRKIPRLSGLSPAELVAALDSPNGWQRDVAQQLLVEKNDRSAAPALEELAVRGGRPQARLHALCTLDGMNALTGEVLGKALKDAHPGVRRHAVRLCEGRFDKVPRVAELLSKIVDDPDAKVRLQLACTLGEWNDEAAGALLGRLATKGAGDEYLAAAVFSSVNSRNLVPVMRAVMGGGSDGAPPPPSVVDKLLTVAGAAGDRAAMAVLLGSVTSPGNDGAYETWQLATVAQFLDSLDRRGTSPAKLAADSQLADAVGRLGAVFDAARSAVKRADAPPDRRVAAVRLLGRDAAKKSADVQVLRGLLVPQAPDEVQAAAAGALARAAGADAPGLLLGGWKGYGPALRARVLDVLLRRPDGVAATLDAVAAKKVLPADIDAERRQRLLQSADEAVRSRAAKLLADVVNPDRQKVLEAFAPAASVEGDPSRGQGHFTKLCATCHKLNGAGNDVGPDLAAVTDKSPEFLLTSVIDPNRAVDAKYANYVADTSAGETLSGVLAAETGNSVTLLGADGKAHVLLRTDLKSLRGTGTSLMPEGLEAGLTPQDLADLIAYVRGASPTQPRKSFPGNKPEVVRPGPDGALRLLPSTAEIYGKTLVLEDKYNNLGYWTSEDDRAVWVVEPARPGRYSVWLEFACEDSVANNRFVLQTGVERTKRSVPGTGNWDTYKRQKFGEVSLRLGRQRVTIRTEGPVAGALMDLKSVELVPVR
jgi:putative membrane-bound dehydrogenase-like protein